MYLEHVNMTVADVGRSVDFYGELLGLKVRWRGKTEDGRDAVHIGDDRSYIAMFEARRKEKPAHDYYVTGLNHFGYVVEDLAAAKRQLESCGIEPHLEQDYEPGKRLYFFDPDGIEVELVEYDK